MAAELSSVVLILRLNWKIRSHSSEKYLWISILKPQPPRNVVLVNENLTVQAIISQENWPTSLCHKDFKKHLLIKVNIKELIWIHLRTTKMAST